MRTKITGIMLLLALITVKANCQFSISSVSVTNATTCSACNGSAIANVSGGFSPYTYYWSNIGSFSSSFKDSDLCPGTYTVFAYDSHGDSSSNNSIFIIGPATISVSLNHTNTSCAGNTGTATANVSGGATPYTYLWSPGGASSSSLTGLSAGYFTVTVTDAGGCSKSDSLEILNTGMNITLSSTDILCNGGNTGSISVTNVSGGISPYTYSWSPGSGTNSSITGLSAGAYFVTVTDINGCMGTAYDSINQPAPLFYSTAITGTSCTGNTGSAHAGVSGGTRPYTYSWFPSGGTTATATGLAVGTYTLSITDNHGCLTADTVLISTSGPAITLSIGNDSCNGESNGYATVTSVSGGVSPYTYSWTPSGNTTNSINGLIAGNYSVTVTDNTGCSGTNPVVITQPAPLTLVADTIPDTGSCSGSVVMYGIGGTGPYTFTFSLVIITNADSGIAVVDSVCYGSYYACITDVNGCSACDSIHVRHQSRVTGIGSLKDNSAGIKVYPDPVSDQLFISTDRIKPGNYSLYVYDMIGRQVMNKNYITIHSGETIPLNVSVFPSGKYMLRLSSGNTNKITPFIVTH